MGIYFTKALNEVYFNNNPYIKEMEECISAYRHNLKTGEIRKYNTDPTILQFNRLVEKCFGFDYFCLTVQPQFGMVNAMTIPLTNKLDVGNTSKYLKADSKGFKYNNKHGACVLVFSDLMTRDDLSDREVLAVILHEIGHNFQDSITNKNGIIVSIQKYLILRNVLLAILQNPACLVILTSVTNKGEKLMYTLNKMVRERFPLFQDISDSIVYLQSIFRYIPMKILRKINTLVSIPNILLAYANPMTHANKALNYNNEKIADSFATMYGYGADLSSALVKIHYANDIIIADSVIYKLPIISPIIGLHKLILELLYTGIDVHPNLISRIDAQLKYLYQELKVSDLDPKVRKEIENQINEIESLLENDIYYNNDLSDYNAASKIYEEFLYKNLGKGDLYDFIIPGKSNYKVIQATFDKKK